LLFAKNVEKTLVVFLLISAIYIYTFVQWHKTDIPQQLMLDI